MLSRFVSESFNAVHMSRLALTAGQRLAKVRRARYQWYGVEFLVISEHHQVRSWRLVHSHVDTLN